MRSRYIIGIYTALALGAVPADAAHINPYNPTPCDSSWDGTGFTACELIGQPGVIGAPISFLAFAPAGNVLWSITARPDGTLVRNFNGSLTYANGFDTYNSFDNPLQFAYWEDEKRIIVGVEDLVNPSDYDYNDYVVEFERAETVPEPSVIVLLGLTFGGMWRRFRNGQIF